MCSGENPVSWLIPEEWPERGAPETQSVLLTLAFRVRDFVSSLRFICHSLVSTHPLDMLEVTKVTGVSFTVRLESGFPPFGTRWWFCCLNAS